MYSVASPLQCNVTINSLEDLLHTVQLYLVSTFPLHLGKQLNGTVNFQLASRLGDISYLIGFGF